MSDTVTKRLRVRAPELAGRGWLNTAPRTRSTSTKRTAIEVPPNREWGEAGDVVRRAVRRKR